MGNPLRDRRTPLELAAAGQVFEISEKISNFEHLARIVGGDLQALEPDTLPHDWRDARVLGRLEFGYADARQGLAAVEGRVAVTLDAVCQRCLGPLRLPLDVDIRLLFDAGEARADVDDGYEVWEMDEDRLRPGDLVEELLIMALPLVAMHADEAECQRADDVADAGGETTRPFADLKSRMDNEC